jgi:hypothetical protein
VNTALAVMVETEWLASRPTIPPIVAVGIDIAKHVRTVVRNVIHLADNLDRILESDITMRRHQSDVVDAAYIIAVDCRLFAIQWAAKQTADAEEFNANLRRLRLAVDFAVRSVKPS